MTIYMTLNIAILGPERVPFFETEKNHRATNFREEFWDYLLWRNLGPNLWLFSDNYGVIWANLGPHFGLI